MSETPIDKVKKWVDIKDLIEHQKEIPIEDLLRNKFEFQTELRSKMIDVRHIFLHQLDDLMTMYKVSGKDYLTVRNECIRVLTELLK